MHLLRIKLGGNWTNVELVLPISHSVRVDVTTGKCEVSAAIASRVAKALDSPSATRSPHGKGAAARHLQALRPVG